MANGLTTATKEDGEIQARRWVRAITPYLKQCVGWSIGRGYESDYLEGIAVSDALRYRLWLAQRAVRSRDHQVTRGEHMSEPIFVCILESDLGYEYVVSERGLPTFDEMRRMVARIGPFAWEHGDGLEPFKLGHPKFMQEFEQYVQIKRRDDAISRVVHRELAPLFKQIEELRTALEAKGKSP